MARDVSPSRGIRLVCHCTDCQAFLHALERDELLDEHGGSDIFQLLPKQVTLDVPEGRLGCLRLSPEGTLRWFTTCCRTPVGNTMPNPKVAFIGSYTTFMAIDPSRLDALLGVPHRIQGRMATKPPVPREIHPKMPAAVMIKTVGFIARGLVTSGHRPSPLFTEDGKPRVVPRVLTLEERREAERVAASR